MSGLTLSFSHCSALLSAVISWPKSANLVSCRPCLECSLALLVCRRVEGVPLAEAILAAANSTFVSRAALCTS